MMTRRDFEAIARIISARNSPDRANPDLFAIRERDLLARELGVYFTEVNPRFDWARFMEACGLTP